LRRNNCHSREGGNPEIILRLDPRVKPEDDRKIPRRSASGSVIREESSAAQQIVARLVKS